MCVLPRSYRTESYATPSRPAKEKVAAELARSLSSACVCSLRSGSSASFLERERPAVALHPFRCMIFFFSLSWRCGTFGECDGKRKCEIGGRRVLRSAEQRAVFYRVGRTVATQARLSILRHRQFRAARRMLMRHRFDQS